MSARCTAPVGRESLSPQFEIVGMIEKFNEHKDTKSMNYTCPYCGHHSTIVGSDMKNSWSRITMNETEQGEIGFGVLTVRCANKECNKLFLRVRLTKTRISDGYVAEGKEIQVWQLLPESSAKVLPDYVPTVIQEDYYEACRIRDLSPKASATLARRCLQGMIRDFFGINKRTLKEEIDAIEEKVDSDTFAAIDAVRSVGNIGAHMESDINLIVDVEPSEAQLLIELIEQLVEDWYVTRRDKQNRLSKITELAKSKKEQKG